MWPPTAKDARRSPNTSVPRLVKTDTLAGKRALDGRNDLSRVRPVSASIRRAILIFLTKNNEHPSHKTSRRPQTRARNSPVPERGRRVDVRVDVSRESAGRKFESSARASGVGRRKKKDFQKVRKLKNSKNSNSRLRGVGPRESALEDRPKRRKLSETLIFDFPTSAARNSARSTSTHSLKLSPTNSETQTPRPNCSPMPRALSSSPLQCC